MADYLVKFVGHLIEEHRPEGFPKTVSHDVFISAENREQLNAGINEETARLYYRQKCFIVPKDPSKMVDLKNLEMDTRLMVPMHMISFISTETTPLVGEVPGKIDLSGFEGPKLPIQ